MASFPNHKQQIEAKALAARREGQYIEIDFMLPSIHIFCGENKQFRFTETEAQNQLNISGVQAKFIGVSVKDLLLAYAQEWTV
jgi:hypothetical protein